MGSLVLIADDERSNLESLSRIFAKEGWGVATAESGAQALEILRRERVAVLVTDLMMPGMSGEALLRAARAVSPETEVVLVTAYGTVEAAVSAMKEGAYDFLTKPVKRHAIVKAVRQALEKADLVAENRALKAQLANLGVSSGSLIGNAPSFRAVVDALRQAAPASATVLVSGESGTGKELAARLLHELSPRASAAFVPINCSAIPESILESELFGYEKGAFTGAAGRKEGRFERAHGGTLFLDEVGEMSPGVQVKLLRVLQDGIVERLGGTQPVKVDVRIVAATNKDLSAEVKAGRFRQDLFYRLNVVAVRLPPLRERREDIPLLASAFLRRLAQKNGKSVTGFTPRAFAALECYDWPGNVRELEHAVERAVVLSRSAFVDECDLPEPVRRARAANGPGETPGSIAIAVGTPMEEVERLVIRETLRHTRGDKTLAAQILGIAARTIYRKLDRNEEGRLVGFD
ncbi:MAG TPA: sigma-54 dependent transcriptional regulator, partial [Anaeromyxobacteraceae bacterium]|nr:sigma-54 dependent transcriptional regulator [Anaeromyxobacteraceae bacterium]